MHTKHTPTILWSLIISIFLIALYYFWYIIADRNILFLYWHMGYGPFGAFTIGRYLMSGLVASGFVFWGYLLLFYTIKKLYKTNKLPQWQTVWEYIIVISAIPLFIIIHIMGNPPLPLLLSLGVLVFLYAGIGIVLWSSHKIHANFKKSIWTMLQSITILPLFVLPLYITYYLKKNPENIAGLIIPVVYFFIGSLLFSLIINVLLRRFKKTSGTAQDIFFFAMLFFYILLPLFHYIFLGPTLFSYITDSGNFFAHNLFIQAIGLLSAYVVAALTNKYTSKKTSNT